MALPFCFVVLLLLSENKPHMGILCKSSLNPDNFNYYRRPLLSCTDWEARPLNWKYWRRIIDGFHGWVLSVQGDETGQDTARRSLGLLFE